MGGKLAATLPAGKGQGFSEILPAPSPHLSDLENGASYWWTMTFCPLSGHHKELMDKRRQWGREEGGECSDVAGSAARSAEMAGFLLPIRSKYGNREDFRRKKKSEPCARNKALIIGVVLRPCLCGEVPEEVLWLPLWFPWQPPPCGSPTRSLCQALACCKSTARQMCPFLKKWYLFIYACVGVRHSCQGTYVEVR